MSDHLSAMAALSALPGELVGKFLLVLAAEAEAVRPFRAILDPLGEVRFVGGLVGAPRLPLTGVVGELRLVHHGDAGRDRADGLADAAAAASLEVCVIEPLGGDVEDAVRTLQPAERALDALVEVDHRPHGARRPLLERWVAPRTPAALLAGDGILHLAAEGDSGDGDSLAHLGPFWHLELVGFLRVALV